jgi:hypothetical protein
MSDTISIPNTPSAVPATSSATGLEAIAQKMTAMRNQIPATNQTETGSNNAAALSAPVAPEGSDTSSVEPEVVIPEGYDIDEPTMEANAPEAVSDAKVDSTSQDIIDFVEFATENPNAKFKFMRNGKEMIIDAKQAQAILGQGGAIHEDARQLKIERAEFEEFVKEQQSQQAGLTLAMEFVVQPQLQAAYDEIRKIQSYNATFAQQYQQTNDPAEHARIESSIKQNEAYIQSQYDTVRKLKPNIEYFQQVRKQQVGEILDKSRKAFNDKELKNDYVYNELRDKVAKGWSGANGQIVPGINNIDLISSDEHILSLLRDGLKYRERPQVKSAGSSIAALTGNRSGIANSKSANQANMDNLQEKARQGDKKAQDNLLLAKLNAMRGRR